MTRSRRRACREIADFHDFRLLTQPLMAIVRRCGSRDVALLPARELAGLMETAHLLRSPKSASRLLAALNRAEQGKGSARPLPICAGKFCASKGGKLAKEIKRLAVFQPEFREDLQHWVESDRSIALRAVDLVEAVMRDSFAGPGKPEPLRYALAGCRSRRVTLEHRLVYRVADERIDFLQARYHY